MVGCTLRILKAIHLLLEESGVWVSESSMGVSIGGSVEWRGNLKE
jgi:hypothetical protein